MSSSPYRSTLGIAKRWFSAILIVLWSLCVWLWNVSPAWAEVRLPTRIWEVPYQSAQGQSTMNVLLPDWSQISFGNFPPINSSGSIDGRGYASQLGYDMSRSWQSGMTPDQYLKLGDIAEALRADVFSLDAIGQIIGTNLKEAALSAFSLAGKQTLQHLVNIVPGLGELPIQSVKPIVDLVNDQLGSFGGTGIGGGTIKEILANNELLGNLKLGEIDLSQYAIGDIPGLEGVELGQFQEWGNAFLNGIPGLSQVALSKFPNPIAEVGNVVSRIDMIYSDAENDRQDSISGSNQVGFSVPCEQEKCAYIELDDLEDSGAAVRSTFEGKQWISGKYQEVPGGFGVLGNLNGGKEPTGRHPFGDTFKVVIMEPDETTDTVDSALFFRFCNRWPVDLGCTPYFIGPIPFFSYKVNAPIFVGLLDNMHPASSSTPTGASRASRAQGQQGEPGKYGSGQTDNQAQLDPDCFETTGAAAGNAGQAINLENLQEAIASIESAGSGGYSAVGVHTCADGGRNCGRGLGRYQFMSYNEHASSLIADRPGGQAFLDRVKGGYKPTQADLMQYFPPEDQDRAFQSSLAELANRASRQTDPTTGKPFTGDRLIERVAQMHFGGPYSRIDGGSSDALGRLSLKQYGQEAAKVYRSIGGSVGNVCAPQTTGDRSSKDGTKPPANGQAGSSGNSNSIGTGASSNNPATAGTMRNPVQDGTRVSSEYGPRRAPVAGASSDHKGIDLAVPEGTPVRAAMTGKVIYAGWARGYGNLVILEHANSLQTRYAHLSTIKATNGTQVEAGAVIALSGNTGYSSGPHLHFEVREGATPGKPFSGKAVNPRQYIRF